MNIVTLLRFPNVYKLNMLSCSAEFLQHFPGIFKNLQEEQGTCPTKFPKSWKTVPILIKIHLPLTSSVEKRYFNYLDSCVRSFVVRIHALCLADWTAINKFHNMNLQKKNFINGKCALNDKIYYYFWINSRFKKLLNVLLLNLWNLLIIKCQWAVKSFI